ncbi:hypothetical protein F5ESL0233_04380 [Lactobacillus sp. ESL0233]|uniref:hypothetical protein n=1 Tax=Lactobacillus sp. ESL0233 TaxID=2069354 RepID=UPI000EFB1942|nr:hypothetical protein [Lactobacillus sp. ESL0233]RMC41566.1 hypothetical protein F5ESL0233_04380 [Lactobacillus sp. ESL0233]
MFTELNIIIKKATKLLSVSYNRTGHNYSHNKTPLKASIGGFIEQDWINVGNDLRRGILDYGTSKFK